MDVYIDASANDDYAMGVRGDGTITIAYQGCGHCRRSHRVAKESIVQVEVHSKVRSTVGWEVRNKVTREVQRAVTPYSRTPRVRTELGGAHQAPPSMS